jgi:thiosulfate dehydrogenase [quinone] large subunit
MKYNKSQQFVLVLMRVLIGWHFLYEGLLKLLTPGWTAKRYLMGSEGFMDGFFTWLSSDSMIGLINFATIALLLIVGLTLMLGIFEKVGILAGVTLLTLFYLAQPSIPGFASEMAPSEGNYFIINKNLIEMAALLVLWHFPTSRYFGLSQFFNISKPAAMATK